MHFADQLDFFGSERAFERVPACIRAELGTCLAPCAGGIGVAGYMERVREAREFLEGSTWRPLTRLNEAMIEAARRMDYEYAAILRDRLERIRRFQEDLAAYRGELESLRFVYRVEGHNGARRLYLIRGGLIVDSAAVPRSRASHERLALRVEKAFAAPATGPAGLTAHQAAEILLVARWFKLHPDERDRTFPPETWEAVLEESASSGEVAEVAEAG
jgi:excinuclease ABC subunit C